MLWRTWSKQTRMSPWAPEPLKGDVCTLASCLLLYVIIVRDVYWLPSWYKMIWSIVGKHITVNTDACPTNVMRDMFVLLGQMRLETLRWLWAQSPSIAIRMSCSTSKDFKNIIYNMESIVQRPPDARESCPLGRGTQYQWQHSWYTLQHRLKRQNPLSKWLHWRQTSMAFNDKRLRTTRRIWQWTFQFHSTPWHEKTCQIIGGMTSKKFWKNFRPPDCVE